MTLEDENAQLATDAIALSERARIARRTHMPGPADSMDVVTLRLLVNALARRAHRPVGVQRHLVEELGR